MADIDMLAAIYLYILYILTVLLNGWHGIWHGGMNRHIHHALFFFAEIKGRGRGRWMVELFLSFTLCFLFSFEFYYHLVDALI